MRKIVYLLLLLILLIHNKGQSQTLDTLITIDKHKLHFEIIKGKGTPILFEAGNGNDCSVWKPLLQNISKATGAPLITYDRAGLGKSEIDTTKISFKREVKNLDKILEQLGYGESYFLVAHSFGGFYASEFAQINKNKINGAVFIDTATPCLMTKEWASDYKNSLPADVWAMLKQHRVGLYYVLQNLPTIATYMSTRFITNEMPLTLIVAENLPDANTLKTEEDKVNWVQCLQDFGRQSNHNYVVAKGADHKIWEKSPELVIKEIIQLYKLTNL